MFLSPGARRAEAGVAAGRRRGLLVGAAAVAALLPASSASAGPVAFNLTGTTTINSVFTETASVNGGLAGDLSSTTGAFSGKLSLTQPAMSAVVKPIEVYSPFPVRGRLDFVSAGKTTGSLTDGVLSVRLKLRARLRRTNLMTFIPLPLGPACQTKQYSDVELKSASGFDPAAGGTLSATFATSDFNGCSALVGVVGPFVAGAGNTLNLTVAPKG